MENSTLSAPALSRRTKLIYGMGDWGASAATTARNAFWFVFLTNVVGVNPALAGTVVLVGKLWDSINDPLVGMISDRMNTRWGRRRPFLLFGAIPFALTFILLFLIPPTDNANWLALYYAIAYLLFDTMYTIINVPYTALTPELSDDYDERSDLAGWRMSISILAALVTGAFFTLLAEDVFGQWFGIRTGYALTAVIWSFTLAIPLLFLAKHIEEPDRPPNNEPMHPIETFKDVFRNRPFRYAAAIYLLSFTATDVMLVVFIRYLVDYVRVSPGFDNLIIALFLSIAFISMPLVVKMMHIVGKRKTYIMSMMLLIVALGLVALTPPGGQNMLLWVAVLVGIGYGAANAVPWAMVADVVEVDELRTGKRREGVYAGHLVFFRKMASAFAIFMVGQLLALSGFVTSTSGGAYVEQPESALLTIRLLTTAVPALFFVIAIVVANKYPLTRERHNEIRRQLAARKQATI
jgi:GPH family glycoside/pentoside/hexuronide:cation symporter